MDETWIIYILPLEIIEIIFRDCSLYPLLLVNKFTYLYISERICRAIQQVENSKRRNWYSIRKGWADNKEKLCDVYNVDPFVFPFGIRRFSLKEKYDACCAIGDSKLVGRISGFWHRYCALGNGDSNYKINEQSFIYPPIKSGNLEVLKAAITGMQKGSRLSIKLKQNHIVDCSFDMAVFLLIDSREYFHDHIHKENLLFAIEHYRKNKEIGLLTILESYLEQRAMEGRWRG
jgi:hypothetical protein